MGDPSASKFISSLVKSLQMLCHGHMDFDDNIEIIGHINLRIDNRRKLDYIVNEQVSKQGQESTRFQSNSYHSLPPATTRFGEHEQLHSNEAVKSRHDLNKSMAVFGESPLQIDLSGPVSISRNSFSSFSDRFIGSVHSNQHNHQSKDSQVHGTDLMHASPSITQDNSFDHSQTKAKEMSGVERADSRDCKSEASLSLTFPDIDAEQSESFGNMNDIVIKSEPVEHLHPTLGLQKSGDKERGAGLIEAFASNLLSEHEARQSSSGVHSDPVSLPTTSLPQLSSFDSAFMSLDVLGSGRSEAQQKHCGNKHRTRLSTAHTDGRYGEGTPVSTQSPLQPVISAGSMHDADWLGANRLESEQHGRSMPSMSSTPSESDASHQTSPIITNRKWWCSKCAKFFRSSELLDLHMQFVHRKVEPGVSKSQENCAVGMTMTDVASTSSDTVSPDASHISRRLQNEMTGDSFFNSDHRMKRSFLNPTEASRPRYSDVRTKEFSPYAHNPWMYPTHTIIPSSQNNCEPQLPNMSGKSSESTCSSVYTHPPLTSTAQSHDIMNSRPSYSTAVFSPSHSALFKLKSNTKGKLGGERKPVRTGRRCRHCHKIFQLNNNVFADHEQNCKVEWLGQHCGQCGRRFASKVALKDHVDSMHSRKGFQCRACGMVFKWRTYVYQHRYKCAAYKIKRELT